MHYGPCYVIQRQVDIFKDKDYLEYTLYKRSKTRLQVVGPLNAGSYTIPLNAG